MRKRKHYVYVSRLMRKLEDLYEGHYVRGSGNLTITRFEGMTLIMPSPNAKQSIKRIDARNPIPEEIKAVIYSEEDLLWRLDLSGLEYDRIKSKYIIDCDLTGVKGSIPIQDFKNGTLRIAYCRLPRVDFFEVDTSDCFLRGSDLSQCVISARQIFSSVGMDAGEDDGMPTNLTKFPRTRIQKKDIPYGKLESLAGLDLTKLHSLDVGLFTNIPCSTLKLPSRLTFNEVNLVAQPYLHFSMEFLDIDNPADLSREFPYYLLLFCSHLARAEIKAHFPKNLSILPRELLPQIYKYVEADLTHVENFPSELIFAGDSNMFFYTVFPAGTDFSKAKLDQFDGCSCAGPCTFSEENIKNLQKLYPNAFAAEEYISLTKESADALSAKTLSKIAKTKIRVGGMNIFDYITTKAKENSPIGAKMKRIALRFL